MTSHEIHEYMRDRIGFHNCVEYRDGKDDTTHLYPPDYFLKVPCGRCSECRKHKRNEWSVRLLIEMEQHPHNCFLTLTLDDYYLDKFKGDYKRPLKLYLDRLRKALGFRPRYFFVPELGEDTKRYHYHGILFGVEKDSLPYDLIHGKWSYGFSYVGYVNHKTAHYVTKYMLKYEQDFKPFVMCSNGIGLSYVKPGRTAWHVNGFDFRNYVNFHGRLYPLASYYRRYLYDDDIKLVNMLNRVNEAPPEEWELNGVKYSNFVEYMLAKERHYKDTLRAGMSFPLKSMCNSINIENNGKFCVPEVGSLCPKKE